MIKKNEFEYQKMKEDHELEFKEIVKNHIANKKKLIYINDFWSLLKDPIDSIDILISCFHDEFGYKSLQKENKLTQLYNFLFVLDKIMESNQVINVVLIRFWRKTFHRYLNCFNHYDKLIKLMTKINHTICSHCHLINDIKKTQSQNNLKCYQDFSITDNDSFTAESAPSEPSSSKNIFELFDKNKHNDTDTDTTTNTNTPCLNKNKDNNKSQLKPSSSTLSIKTSDNALAINCHDIVSFDIEEEGENDNVTYKTNSSEVKLITIDLLLKKIACEEYYSSNIGLMNSFVDQFHCFIPATILIQKIIMTYDHFSTNSNKQQPIDLLLFLTQIIQKKYHSDLKGDMDLFKQISSFYQNLLQSKTITNQSMKRIKDIIDNAMTIISSVDHVNDNEIVTSLETKHTLDAQLIVSFDIFEHKESDIALHLTKRANKLINNINPNELLFSSENREAKAPNLSKLIHRSNKLTLFIIEDICSYDHKKNRSKAIEKYILIANELKKLNNFNDLLIIISALSHTIIQNILINTWTKVDKKHKELFAELNHFVSFEELYKNIRTKIEECQGNQIEFTPYVGITLKKLSFLDEGTHYIKNKRLINFEKIVLVDQVINEFKDYKKNLFEMTDNNRLGILDNINPKTEKELIILAKLLEPSFRLMKKKSKIKRVTKTESTIKCLLNVD